MATDALLALTTMTASGCLTCQEEQPASSGVLAAAPPVTPASAVVAPAAHWSGVIGVEGEMTGDGRLIELNALRWENLPLPLRYVEQDSGEHDGAVVVGMITAISRGQNGAILGEGTFDTAGEVSIEAMRQVAENLTTGISMDLDDVSFEIRIAKELMEEEDDMMMPLLMAAEPVDPSAPGEADNEPVVDADGRIKVMEMNADDEVRVTTDGRIRAATIVAIPAFASAQIHLVTETAPVAAATTATQAVGDEPVPAVTTGKLLDGTDCSCDEASPQFDPDCDCSVPSPPPNAPNTDVKVAVTPPVAEEPGEGTPAEEAMDGMMPDGVTPCSCDETADDFDPDCDCTAGEIEEPPAKQSVDALIAAAVPLAPPAMWFSKPKFSREHPLTVTAEGRVYGHLAGWNTCHISHTQQGQCVKAPHSASGYAYFHTGSVLTADGAEIPVGHITLDTRHANAALTPAATASHYEDTGTVVADVASGEDEFGIWVAGALRPTVTSNQVRALRSSPLSGDWRRIGASLELVAALAVNVPGFPIPRPSGLVAGGVVRSLMASGMLAPRTVARPGTPGALSLDDLRYLKRLVARERAAESIQAAVTVVPDAESLSRRVKASALAMRARRTK